MHNRTTIHYSLWMFEVTLVVFKRNGSSRRHVRGGEQEDDTKAWRFSRFSGLAGVSRELIFWNPEKEFRVPLGNKKFSGCECLQERIALLEFEDSDMILLHLDTGRTIPVSGDIVNTHNFLLADGRLGMLKTSYPSDSPNAEILLLQ